MEIVEYTVEILRRKKGRETRDQIANIRWIIEKTREFQKNIYFCFIDDAKAFDCVDHQKMENSERGGNTRPPYQPPEKSVCRSRSKVRTGHGTMDWFQTGKGVHQGCVCHPAYLTYMQSTSCTMLGWMKHKLESRFLGEVSATSGMQMTPLLWQKTKRN